MKKALLAIALAGTVFSVSAKDLTFGMETTYPPFEYNNENNQLVGFDVDIANKICANLQYTCKFVNQSFDSLIPSLKTRRIDATISGIDITPERSEQVDFTQAYYDNSAQFITLKGAFNAIDQLDGKRVGIQNGTTHQKYLMDKFPQLEVVSYDSYQYAVLDLKAGRIDAIFSDSAVADEWLKKDSDLVDLGEKVVDPEYFGSGLGIAVRKGNTDLLEQFNNTLTEMKNDGSYDEIYAKWFSK
ncbi:arginine transport system substrate-binding protein [Orbus hercynius]|uniref:Arginine transport system substrate-binding protein n=1 Tax=Orbus hercynius TaxID=593135 RepID=A0A495RL78_9GAMM|nr:lysine/arginine/ornithine ABC transporter substrate-binding protein [Orbus hercynius]RKS87548.1 arginine transport system substrate-binding protein [Orbus hercynius]